MTAPMNQDSLLLEIASESEMDDLGRAISGHLQPGDVVCLDGQLGAGKTRLVRAVIAALDCPQLWAGSPTFVLVQEYEGRLPVYHMDAYRLKDSAEFRNLGGEDYLWGDGVCLIEWSQRIADALPADALRVMIEVASPTARVVKLQSGGERSRQLLNAIAKALSPRH
jgi:tRNA threonylcarbamoyladenosine biosynthesis protein TsaE